MGLCKFKVDDLTSKNNISQIIFILESPHKDEYIHSHPIAGQAGTRLLSLLKRVGAIPNDIPNKPLGCLIKSGEILNISIMNASPFPLDKNFYCQQACNSKMVDALAEIKNRLQKHTQTVYKPREGVESKLCNDFSERLRNMIADKTKVIIPLGHVASNFVKSVQGINCKVHFGVMHPSAREWESADNIKQLRLALTDTES
ncbi:hypothetical protein GCM10011502_26200 [Oceanisphaera marina]|uniref:Uracil-DNA glycosylase-like domain-containing protein n=1 Tax=Oceanisphaera marina TaxID=2017550 RepID=A0ABQ1ITZ9_9GAMM|nr:hypothetical protein [Oceanisphaera marina]GGB51811.1 hypothetical protein GCM10011502_26200 [Oceanisphaera marina]